MEIDILIDQSYFFMEESPEQQEEPDLSGILSEFSKAVESSPEEDPKQLLFEILMAAKIEMSAGASETPDDSDYSDPLYTIDSSPEMLPMEIMLDISEEESEEESEESEKQGEAKEEHQGENGDGINVTGQNDLKVEEDIVIQIRRPERITGFFN